MANTGTLIRQVARRNFRPGSVANVNMSHNSGLTVEKLKTELRCRGATTRGKKIDLIERLESYDRNNNFCHSEDDIKLPEPIRFESWPVTGFKQLMPLHKDSLPPLASSDVEAYFRYRLAVDNEETGDLKAIEKGHQLLESNHVLACSVVIHHHAYFSGLVSAAMKKKVSYSLRIIIAECGEVVNTHCECPAGKGPHGTCKHLASVLLMLSQFKSTGVIATGKYRNSASYRDHVRNITINYCSSASKDITIRYLFERASLSSAVRDHDYLDKPFTEYWVERALKITDDQAADLESKTRKQAKCSLWHEERRWRLTASQFGTICKCTTRRNKTKLCEQIVSGRKLVCNSVRHGLQQEPKAIAKLEIACNVHVHSCGMFVDSELPFLAATPDGVIDSNTIVEVKCPYSARNEVIAPGKLFPYLCERNGLMQLKENNNYYFQVQGQMYLSKRKYCLFAVCTFKDFFVQKISLNEEYCTGSLIPRLSLFFESFLKPYIATHCIC
ncbi:uncharacterized protein LOC124137475 [Haliotis rufescens]|uniref:uncharacterized protein LOC124137475 n=1 Tax=Haliotis rufescens TaxID=6454 RepID=UPI00201F87FA|nr:uncharacterized protein LOC124137475 [Haliotis rufescens]